MGTATSTTRSNLWKQAAEYEKAVAARRKRVEKAFEPAALALAVPKKAQEDVNGVELLAARLNAERVVKKSFHQWKAVETLLASSATLLLKDVVPSLALFVVGRGGCGKTTAVEMFSQAPLTGNDKQNELVRLLAEQENLLDAQTWFLPRDRFTASSILSMHSDPRTKKKELEDRALFRVAKHHVIVTAELSRVFTGGNNEERGTLFSIIQQWLDGRGVLIDSGTHGVLGEKGDFSFVWIGATTPFQLETWKMMAALGPRLLFYRVRSVPEADQKVADDEYGGAVEECRQAIYRVTTVLRQSARRSQPWPKANRAQKDAIRAYAQLAVRAQSFPKVETPDPNHIRIRLSLLAAGRALLHGRSQLDDDDVAMAKHVARSSTPQRRGDLLFSLMDAGAPLTTYELEKRTHLQSHWILNITQELKASGVLIKTPSGAWDLNSAPRDDDDDGW